MNCVKLRKNGDIPLKNRADVLRWQKVYDLFHFIFRQKYSRIYQDFRSQAYVFQVKGKSTIS